MLDRCQLPPDHSPAPLATHTAARPTAVIRPPARYCSCTGVRIVRHEIPFQCSSCTVRVRGRVSMTQTLRGVDALIMATPLRGMAGCGELTLAHTAPVQRSIT